LKAQQEQDSQTTDEPGCETAGQASREADGRRADEGMFAVGPACSSGWGLVAGDWAPGDESAHGHGHDPYRVPKDTATDVGQDAGAEPARGAEGQARCYRSSEPAGCSEHDPGGCPGELPPCQVGRADGVLKVMGEEDVVFLRPLCGPGTVAVGVAGAGPVGGADKGVEQMPFDCPRARERAQFGWVGLALGRFRVDGGCRWPVRARPSAGWIAPGATGPPLRSVSIIGAQRALPGLPPAPWSRYLSTAPGSNGHRLMPAAFSVAVIPRAGRTACRYGCVRLVTTRPRQPGSALLISSIAWSREPPEISSSPSRIGTIRPRSTSASARVPPPERGRRWCHERSMLRGQLADQPGAQARCGRSRLNRLPNPSASPVAVFTPRNNQGDRQRQRFVSIDTQMGRDCASIRPLPTAPRLAIPAQ